MMMECITDFSCVAKLALIATASIALIAALIALGAIWAQMHIVRKQRLSWERVQRGLQLYLAYEDALERYAKRFPPPRDDE